MSNVTNKAYVGQAGTIVLDGDTQFGVTAFGLVPTTPRETVVDISGDVQIFTGKPTWVANIEFHRTTSRTARCRGSRPSWPETSSRSPTPRRMAERGRSGNIRWEDVPFGGNTGRHSVSQGLGVVGQPSIIPPAGG